MPSTKSGMMNVVVCASKAMRHSGSCPSHSGTGLWVQLHLAFGEESNNEHVLHCWLLLGINTCCSADHLKSLSSHTAGATTPETKAHERSESTRPRKQGITHKTEPNTSSEKCVQRCPMQGTSEYPELDARERCSFGNLYTNCSRNEVLSHPRAGEDQPTNSSSTEVDEERQGCDD